MIIQINKLKYANPSQDRQASRGMTKDFPVTFGKFRGQTPGNIIVPGCLRYAHGVDASAASRKTQKLKT